MKIGGATENRSAAEERSHKKVGVITGAEVVERRPSFVAKRRFMNSGVAVIGGTSIETKIELRVCDRTLFDKPIGAV